MHIEVVKPNIKNFIKSLRDIGYSFEVAVADIIDNSITAKSKNIKIYGVQEPDLFFYIFDDGVGMSEDELTEAMRLSSKDPSEIRDKNDLGKFGLGLKIASFSQCKKLTVISKKNNKISAKCWDLDYISQQNEWCLITPSIEKIQQNEYYNKLNKIESGTIVVWESIDRYPKSEFSEVLYNLKNHLSLVFHRFIEAKQLKILLNNGELEAFNPFNPFNLSTQQISEEKLIFFGEEIKIQPYVLPHHSKLTIEEYDRYATEDGYIKSQGFYLYRANRLLIHGTWWGLHKISDAHKLVRIKIDIPNNQDEYWGIDVKKSTAKPHPNLKNDLKRIISTITPKSAKVFSGRGKIIENKNNENFWTLISINNNFIFDINKKHPILKLLIDGLSSDKMELLKFYLKNLVAYLPLESIQAHLQQNPLKIKQKINLNDEEIIHIFDKLKNSGIPKEYIDNLLEIEVFKNKKELFDDKK